MIGYLLVFFLGIFLGGFIAYWFEDTLRGPIMRAYDDFAMKPAEDGRIIPLEDD